MGGTIYIKKGREKSLLRRHPWIFSGAVERTESVSEAGETVEVRLADGAFAARAAWSPRSQIAARVWSFDPAERIDPSFFRSRIARAASLRARLSASGGTDAYRVVHSESDGLPGLIVDRYADFLVCQFLSAGAEKNKRDIVSGLLDLLPGRGIYERSDADVREKEGLSSCVGVLAGDPPPELVEIREGLFRFFVDIYRGHKTGFYLDQRENRAALSEFAAGARVLNCFSYTGGFALPALGAGAETVVNVDASAPSLDLALRNATLNGFDPGRVENIAGDVFQVLRRFRDSGREFDLIVLDPPKFAESRSRLEGAARGYKDINLLAFRLLRPGGALFTFSCSGLLDTELFQKIVADAALDARRDAVILRRLSQAADHPTHLAFPEGTYLKGLVCRIPA